MDARDADELDADGIADGDDEDEDETEGPTWRVPRGAEKLQRLIDLLAALLVRRRPATFDEISRDVPQYVAATSASALERMFERDKDDLRQFGINIETKEIDGAPVGYQIETKGFYLPYLTLVAAAGRRRIRPTSPGLGYQSLATMTFTSDELAAIADAGMRVRQLGDPVLALEAETALRKLAIDLPLDSALGETVPPHAAVVPVDPPEPKRFHQLSDALVRHKTVAFRYYTIARDQTTDRRVEPYGLFFVSGHWYLAGRDCERDAVRNFRLSRMDAVSVNARRANSPDFAVPASFDLRAHARSREPWEIGNGDAMHAEVVFRVRTGAVEAASRLGKPVEGHAERRTFEVRRLDAFARWLLSFGDDVAPVAPADLVAMHRDLAHATRALYAPSRPAGAAS